ncbi:MAG: thioredoxin family protein [Fimbriimonadaceae bacterium]|nr:thioredoxin family protein [Fimbriimonadaceae bacterium]
MNRFKILSILLLTLIASFGVSQTPPSPFATWSIKLDRDFVRAGESAQIILTIDLQEGWHAYQIGQEGGPQGTDFKIDPESPVEMNGPIVAPKPGIKFDKNFNIDVGFYEEQAIFAIPIKVKEGTRGAHTIKVYVTSQVCDASSCDRPRRDLELTTDLDIEAGDTRADHTAAITTLPDQEPQEGTEKGSLADVSVVGETGLDSTPGGGGGSAGTEEPPKTLLGIFALGLATGFLALLTPCVFPMIPVTISYFSKNAEGSFSATVKTALIYCLGIIASFTVLGLAVTIALGPAGTQELARNPWVNAGLALLFIVLAISLFGVFELVLPSGLVTRVSNMNSKGGAILGPFLMGLTFAITSFTCTVPVVGALLAGAASGDRLYPAVGMIGFSLALSIPFFMLAVFPQFLKKLPKSGSWMVTVKAFMGFLELAAALKFISNIDLVYQWQILTRPVFLSIWAALFLIAGLYLWGWLLLPKDTSSKIGSVRRIFGVATVGLGIWCIAALNGASLGVVTGLLPPSDYGRYSAKHEGPEWITNDFAKAVADSKASGKPILIDFTGWTCTNCRDMEDRVFPLADVEKEFEKYTLVRIYVDQKGREEELGGLQDRLAGEPTLPNYLILKPGTEEKVAQMGYPSGADKKTPFLEFLQENHAKAVGSAVAQK